jgi:hypothetical protein
MKVMPEGRELEMLVAITRKRVKQSPERMLCSPCLNCQGAAYVKNPHRDGKERSADAPGEVRPRMNLSN